MQGEQPSRAGDIDRTARLDALARGAPRRDPPPWAVSVGPVRERRTAHRARLTAVHEVIRRAESATGGVARAALRMHADHRHTDVQQRREVDDPTHRLVGRDAHDEGQLDRVDVAEPRDVALVEHRRGQRDIGAALQSERDDERIGRLRPAQVWSEVVDQLVLAFGGDGAQQRQVDPGESTVGEPQLEASAPLGFGGGPPDREAAIHQQVRMHRDALARIADEAQEQVLAERVGSFEHRAREIETDEARIANHRTDTALPREAIRDALGEPADGVALGHPTMMPEPSTRSSRCRTAVRGKFRRVVRMGVVPASGLIDADIVERSRLLHAIADAGLDGVLQADHVSFRTGVGTEAIVMMAGLSGAHPTLGLHIGVYLLPLRHPVTVARSLATLAQLAPGRVVFGVGIGGEDRHEVEVCGVDPRTRGRRCDASLEVLRALLDGQTVTHHDEFFDIDDCRIVPAPMPAMPLLVGGRSDAAARRAGRFGDGWLGAWCSARRFREVAGICEHVAAASGRGVVAWRHKYQPWVGLAATKEEARGHVATAMRRFYGLPFEAFEKYTPYGTPTDVAEALAPHVEAGVCEFDMSLCAADTDAAIEMAGEVKRLLNG